MDDKLTDGQILGIFLEKMRDAIKPKQQPVALEDGWILIEQTPVHKVCQKEVSDGFLTLIIEKRVDRDDPEIFRQVEAKDGSKHTLRLHASMSHNSRIRQVRADVGEVNTEGRMPTWDELKDARYRFLPDQLNFAIMMPPSEDYVNLHKTCLHLLEIPVEMALKPSAFGI